jgi:hypothetical protein
MAVTKEAFLQSGGFDPALNIREDSDLSQRLRRFGRVKLDPKFIVRTSGRRYSRGLWSGLRSYGCAILPAALRRKRASAAKLTTLRAEPVAKHSPLITFTVAVAMLLAIFVVNSPATQAQQAKLRLQLRNAEKRIHFSLPARRHPGRPHKAVVPQPEAVSR